MPTDYLVSSCCLLLSLPRAFLCPTLKCESQSIARHFAECTATFSSDARIYLPLMAGKTSKLAAQFALMEAV